MKENNNKKANDSKKNVEEKLPSKGKIAAAWFLLIILLACTGGLVYLKNFKTPVEEINETEENATTISQAITTALTTITDNFNSNAYLTEYEEAGLTLTASLEELTITIDYTSDAETGSIQYLYNTTAGNLVANITLEEETINDKIFRILILACRERLNLTEDVTDKIDNFFVGEEVTGLQKETTSTGFTYSISVSSPIYDTTTNQEDTKVEEEPEEDNTTSQTNDTDSTTSTNTNDSPTNTTTSEDNTTVTQNTTTEDDNSSVTSETTE